MNECRSVPGAAVCCGLLEGPARFDEIGSVCLNAQQTGDALQQTTDTAARSLPFHRDRDGVTVVLNQKDDRQPLKRRCIDRLPKLAFAGRAFAGADEREFISLLKLVARAL